MNKEQIWFQSDQFLSNITNAIEFRVKKRWFHKEWNLYAILEEKKVDAWGDINIYHITKLIGRYRSDVEASLALTQARKALGVQVVGGYEL